jgi:SAM-dependent methyltransferase
MKVNLGCSDRPRDGYLNVDRSKPAWATSENFLLADLSLPWPWPDSSIDVIRADDIIEHLPDKMLTMNEAHRVLVPGGRFEIFVPTTDGRGAFQDPTHVSYWNRNSFFYWTDGDPHYIRFREAYGMRGSFKVISEKQEIYPGQVHKLSIVLAAVK